MDRSRIHWFPGHMAASSRKIKEAFKIVDLIIEIIDARAPLSSRDPSYSNQTTSKQHLLIINKSDLADQSQTHLWLEYFKKQNINAISLNLKSAKSQQLIVQQALKICAPIFEKQISKGMKVQPIKALVIGIPNVGKSTLINRIIKKSSLKVADKPGVTRAPQWIKLAERIWLLDTPGILPMKYEQAEKSIHLALIGSIRRDILPIDYVVSYLFNYLFEHYHRQLSQYVGSEITNDVNDTLKKIAQRFAMLKLEGELDLTSAAWRFFDDFRLGKIGPITLESVIDEK